MPVLTVLIRGIHPNKGWKGSPRNVFADPLVQVGLKDLDYDLVVVSGDPGAR